MGSFKLTLEFSDDSSPLLLDISSLFYDLELAHDFGYLVSSHESYQFDRYFWYRKGRPIPQLAKIKAARIVKESPLLLEVIIPSLGAVWILVQILEKVADRPLVREKLEREIAKLRREEAAHREVVAEKHREFLGRLNQDHQAQVTATRIEERLRHNPIKVVRADIAVLSDDITVPENQASNDELHSE